MPATARINGTKVSFRNRSAAAALAAIMLALGAGQTWGQIHFRNGTVETVKKSPAELSAALTELAARPAANHVVVQFDQPMRQALRQELQAAGMELQGYLGNNAFYAALQPEALNAEALSQVPSFKDVLALQREWKLHPWLARLEVPDYMIVPPTEEARQDPNPVVGTYVMFHADVALEPDGVALVQTYGGWVRSFMHSINGLVVELPLLEVGALADEDAVRYVAAPLPKFSELNNSNRQITQADDVQAAPYGLDGDGVSVLVYDGGTARDTHLDFQGRLTVRDGSDMHYHSTHVAGTIGGAGVANPTHKGMAPGVIIESYGFEAPLVAGFLYTDPGDMEADYSQAINTYGAHISNNSIGTNTAPNGFPCEWEGDYGPTSILIDTMVRGDGSNGLFTSPFRIVWANGNERQTTRCNGPQEYHSTAPPACAKNHIAVGALNSNDDSVTDFTSWGPTDDGRLKPDLSGPGCQSSDDYGVTSCDSGSDTDYTTLCGTSMASPTVCGISALLLQDFRVQFQGQPDPRNSTLKALLAHNAADIQNTGPDYQTGYGSVRIKDTIDFMRTGNFVEAYIPDTGESYTMLVYVQAGDPVFKATLAWDDRPGPEVLGTEAPVLVNDLDLVVTDPSDTRHYPWTLDADNPWNAAVQTAEDHVNNIEQVLVNSPMEGVWQVEVYGYNLPQPGTEGQSFSLAASPLVVNCSSAGTIALKGTYPCEGTAEITVIDCDLNTDDQVAETVTVTIASDSEPTGESVLLTETGGPTAQFVGTIPLSATDATGVLLVAHGDLVTATYIDADDGQGGTNVVVTDTADVDCLAPQISNVQDSGVTHDEAVITFDTDEPARGTVRYGLSCASLNNQASSSRTTTHSIALTGLSENTPYYYAVDAEDPAGNVATEDNGGVCFSFVTTDIPNYFTESFLSDNDLDYLSLTFTVNGSVDFYGGCVATIPELPTDPTGGTELTPGEDSYSTVNLTGGAEALLYGASYSTLYVGSNGYLTFTGGDDDYEEDPDKHFSMPRISALYDDLSPQNGGTVSYKQLADRVAVSYENVPKYSSSGGIGSNTFQVEMFFDGTITVSYLNIDATDGLAGLSGGGGTPAEFYETDLSAMGPCVPTPPTALPADWSTPYTTPLTITLQATDDGLPDPPGALTYIITTLPEETLRDAGNGHIIAGGELPYTLVGGDQVIYEPGLYFVGSDSFEFKGNDGGVPPEGGDSEAAPVTIEVILAPWLQYSFPLDTDPGWSIRGQWDFGQPTGGGTHDGDPDSGHTGTNVYGYNLDGDYTLHMPVYHLTSTAIDCAELANVELRFWKWLGVETAVFDHANVQVSNNGTDWTTVWEHSGESMSDSSWSQMTLDISTVADNQPTVYLRWGMGPTDGSVTYPGWNIDDVEIWGQAPLCGDIAGDFDDDCDVDLSDFATFALCYAGATVTTPPPGCTPEEFAETDLDTDGDVDLSDFGTFALNYTG